MKKIDIVKKYCESILKKYDIDHYNNCESNLYILKNEINIDYKMLDGCPNNYGLDNYIGICEEDNNLMVSSDRCENCWKRALEGEINETKI